MNLNEWFWSNVYLPWWEGMLRRARNPHDPSFASLWRFVWESLRASIKPSPKMINARAGASAITIAALFKRLRSSLHLEVLPSSFFFFLLLLSSSSSSNTMPRFCKHVLGIYWNTPALLFKEFSRIPSAFRMCTYYEVWTLRTIRAFVFDNVSIIRVWWTPSKYVNIILLYSLFIIR